MRAIVLAAGEGRRNRPLTRARPKVMLPVGNRPILEHVVAALHDAEIRDVTMVVGYQSESIQSYFQDGTSFGVRIHYVHQPQAAGSADAFRLGLAAQRATDDVLLVPGDNYLGRDVLSRFLRASEDHDSLLFTTSDDPRQYGVLEVADEVVKTLREKPVRPGTRTISTGIARLTARRAKRIQRFTRSPETDLTDFLADLARGPERLRAVPLEGAWFDVDRPENLLGASALHLADQKGQVEGTVEPGASLVGEIRVGKGSRILNGSYLVGPVVIGEGCEIGPHTVVYGPTSIGDNVTIGPFTELLESVVMEDCRVASGCTLHHAVLDRGVVLAPRVSVDRAHAVPGPSFGAVLGEGSVLGNNVVVQPGSIVGANARIAPHKVVGPVADGARVV